MQLQNFDQKGAPEQIAHRVAQLRFRLEELGLDGWIVPRADAWQGEWVAPRDERLLWISGFSGSAGTALITESTAYLLTDGRYTLQAKKETAADLFEIKLFPHQSLKDIILSTLEPGSNLGYDPRLHTSASVECLSAELDEANIKLIPHTQNPIDELRKELPPYPAQKLEEYPLKYAGMSAQKKIEALKKTIRDAGASAIFLAASDSIAWLLNIRGHIIQRSPVVHGFALISADPMNGIDIWLNLPENPENKALQHIGNHLKLCSETELIEQFWKTEGLILVDPASTPAFFAEKIQSAGKMLAGKDPCILAKSRKSSAEITGAREAHLHDGAAMVRFLHWLETTLAEGSTPLTEIDIVLRLEEERRATGLLRDISFETICGSGPNGAIIHYRVSKRSNRQIQKGDLILIDSGGQYLSGTTDITRTICAGPPGEDQQKYYTLVLKGLIALSSLHFPEGISGRDIDSVARAPLWAEGLDYAHGTGHGVGAYLAVHEGPQAISRRNSTPLQSGMILSIEPGYYRDSEFGIRLENLAVIEKTSPKNLPGSQQMLGFETLSLAPLDRRLILREMLTQTELNWLNSYHAQLLRKLEPLLGEDALGWLRRSTAPL